MWPPREWDQHSQVLWTFVCATQGLPTVLKHVHNDPIACVDLANLVFVPAHADDLMVLRLKKLLTTTSPRGQNTSRHPRNERL